MDLTTEYRQAILYPPHTSTLPTRGFPVANQSIYSFFPVTHLSTPPSPSFRQAPSYTSHASSVSWSIQCNFVHSSSSATRSAFMVLLSWDEGSSAFLTERCTARASWGFGGAEASRRDFARLRSASIAVSTWWNCGRSWRVEVMGVRCSWSAKDVLFK